MHNLDHNKTSLWKQHFVDKKFEFKDFPFCLKNLVNMSRDVSNSKVSNIYKNEKKKNDEKREGEKERDRQTETRE